ncbi:hypothetical protein ACOME3_007688 [Neoechinorhynchus agilis]
MDPSSKDCSDLAGCIAAQDDDAHKPTRHCSVCGRKFGLTSMGLTRKHGPLKTRCLGSSLPPLPPQSFSGGQSDSVSPIVSLISALPQNILKRIPKGARYQCARFYSTLLSKCASEPIKANYLRLFAFPRIILNTNRDSDSNLTCTIKKRLTDYDNLFGISLSRSMESPSIEAKRPKCSNQRSLLAKRVSAKLADFDVRGAVRLLSSTDSFARSDQCTLDALWGKHPVGNPPSLPEVPTEASFQCDISELRKAIASFPNGSGHGAAAAGSTLEAPLRDFTEQIINEYGGLGLRSVVELALPAFLASVTKTKNITNVILQQTDISTDDVERRGVSSWLIKTDLDQVPENSHKQPVWDKPLVERAYNSLKGHLDSVSQTRLVASSSKESGAWLEPSLRWQTSRWDDHIPVERRKMPYLGRHMRRFVSTLQPK